ncbi:MAG: hypothetical protein KatS3mg039_0599 [Candidatus Kapaibacterium sp.]|nr:MAG: hypothetical protein KatS3mg039_0599 [Candidatus Kapabacteria bacterium]
MDCQLDTSRPIELLALLEQESAAVETMLTLAHQLQACLIHFDSAGIENLAREQESLLGLLQQMERKRWELVAARFDLTLERARSLTLSELMQLLLPEERQRLAPCAERLRQHCAQLQLANSINRMLALRGRNSINATIAFVQERNLHAVNTAL